MHAFMKMNKRTKDIKDKTISGVERWDGVHMNRERLPKCCLLLNVTYLSKHAAGAIIQKYLKQSLMSIGKRSHDGFQMLQYTCRLLMIFEEFPSMGALKERDKRQKPTQEDAS